MSSTLMTAPAAGWYRDPADSGAYRWWDGSSWTDHLRVVETPVQTGPVQLAPPQTAPVHPLVPPTALPHTGPVQTTPSAAPAQAAAPPQAAPPQAAPQTSAPPQAAPPQAEPPQAAAPQPAAPQPAPPQPAPPQAPPQAAPQVVIEPVPTHAPVFEQVPAAQEPPHAPAEAAAPAPVAASAIPGPGQVAPPPPARSGSVSLTPAIPVTDQMYWHSAAAEKIEVPRLTHTDSIRVQRAGAAPAFVRDWNDLGSPQTAGVWLLAISPLLYLVVGSVLGFVEGVSGGVFGRYLVLVVAAVATGLNWVFAYLDQRQLRERGYRPAPIGWMLLFPPLAYLIARGRVIRREGMSAWPPELVFVLCIVAIGGLNVLSYLGLLHLGWGG